MTPAAFHAALVAAVTARGQTAQAATPGPWEHVDHANALPVGESTYMGCGSVITMHGDLIGGSIAAPDGDLYPRSDYSPFDDMAHIAANDPARILRDVARDLDVLERHRDHYKLEPDAGAWWCDQCDYPWIQCPELFGEHGLAAAYQITDEEVGSGPDA